MSETPRRNPFPNFDPEAFAATYQSLLRTDFRLSFRYSQGDITAQNVLWSAIADRYATTYAAAAQQLIATTALGLEDTIIQSLSLPIAHKAMGAEPQDITFRGNWKSFSSELLRLSSGDRFDRAVLTEKVAANLAAGDNNFQHHERQGRDRGQDRHFSLFREHVILGRPSGSPTFDVIFADAAELIHDPDQLDLQHTLGELAIGWQDNHPGQDFFPLQMG